MASLTEPRSLKVFPSTGSGHRLCHAHIIPLWDADRDAVRALISLQVRGYTRLTKAVWLYNFYNFLSGRWKVLKSLSKLDERVMT